jgi:uncharacterized protein (TIGR03435 family)
MSVDYGKAGHLHMIRVPLKMLIESGWDVKPYAIEGGPAWIETDRFDVVANTPPGLANSDFQLMMRSLLIERFHLEVHNGEKVMSAYALVMDKGGPKLQETTVGSSDESGCSGQREAGMAHRTCKNTTLGGFADLLHGMAPHYIDLPVVNLTGLNGHYDFKLSWQPEQLQGKGSDIVGPTIFGALRDELGLRLESRKVPVATVVIDRIDRLDSQN